MMKSPLEIAETLCEIGRGKTEVSFDRTFILAMLAGVYIGFGAQLATTVSLDLSHKLGIGFSQLLQGAAFSVGLMLVVISRAELFTGNNLMILSLYDGKIKLKKLLRNWASVYSGNFVGSVILVSIIYRGGLYMMGGNALGVRALEIANAKMSLTFVQALCRGIACNWLVCLAVLMATSASDMTGKMFSCFFPIMTFVACGFEHSIANMYFVPMGLFLKGVDSVVSQSGVDLSNLTWQRFILGNLVPVTIGNIIGGAFFVATLYWYVNLYKH
jgi:formate/nitrite transporter